VTGAERHRQEQLFDRLLGEFQSLMEKAGETTMSAVDSALETASNGLVAAGEFTAESAERLRQFIKRDLLHRDNPALTFRTGDITSAGELSCAGCGWTIVTNRTTVLPPCPHCAETAYRKAA
jgi:isocitrate dehydrogenase